MRGVATALALTVRRALPAPLLTQTLMSVCATCPPRAFATIAPLTATWLVRGPKKGMSPSSCPCDYCDPLIPHAKC